MTVELMQVFDEESVVLNDAGNEDWGENGKRVSHSNQLRVCISKHTNYVLWALMSRGTDCQTLASLSLSEQIRLLLAPLCVDWILYTGCICQTVLTYTHI